MVPLGVAAPIQDTTRGLSSITNGSRPGTAGTTVVMVKEHREISRLVARLGLFMEDLPSHVDRSSVLALRRILLRLHALLKTHLAEEELYIPILEDRLTPVEEAALARALDHQDLESL